MLDKVLEDMDNPDWNVRLQALTEEKQSLLKQIETAQAGKRQQVTQQKRFSELTDFIRQHANGFTEYDDEVTRRVVEKITVLHAQVVRIKYRDSDAEVEQPFT